jgi:RNA-directed DNA polymerase
MFWRVCAQGNGLSVLLRTSSHPTNWYTFLRERGLELSLDKTVISHIKDGFDFLGQNVRKYRNRTLLINPSRKSIRVFLEGVRGIVRDSQSPVAC